MARKWKVAMPDLKKWALGKTFKMIVYDESGKIFCQSNFHEYIQLTDKGQTIEYCSDEGDLQNISRECLEDLYIKSFAYDREYGIDYFTEEEFDRQVKEGEILL